MSWFNTPVPCELIDGWGCGEGPPRRAALIWPRCVDEADKPGPEDSQEGRMIGLDVCRGKGGVAGSLGERTSDSGATASEAKSRLSAMAI
jgi:hypothetical protein